MSLETRIIEDLRAVATGLDTPPPPPVPTLVATAELTSARTRRHRLGTAVLAAAAVVAVVLVGRQIGGDSTPQPARPVPTYYAPGLPYVFDDVLYVGHVAQPGAWGSADSRGRGTVARPAFLEGRATLFLDGVLALELERTRSEVAFSATGTVAAWMEGAPHAPVLRSYDLVAGRDLGRVTVDLPPPDPEVLIDLVENDGTVHFQVQGDARVWTPGSAPRPDPDGPVEYVFEPLGFPAGVSVSMSPDHLWGVWFAGQGGVPIDDRADTDLAPLAETVAVQKPGDSESRFLLELPADSRPDYVSWSSPTVFEIIDDRHPVEIARCDLVKRRCEDTWMG